MTLGRPAVNVPMSPVQDRSLLSAHRIAVVYGPNSAEDALYMEQCPHEDWSLTFILETLWNNGLTAEHVDPTAANFVDRIRTFDVAFLNAHGPFGEDGRLQGLLDYLGIPYTCSGVLAGSVGMDKLVAKAVFRSLGVPVLPDSGLIEPEPSTTFPLPAMVKAVDGGSSVGVRLVGTEGELQSALAEFAAHGYRRCFLEKFLDGRLVTVSVVSSDRGVMALEPLEIVTESAFYDEDAKLGGSGAPAVDYSYPDGLSSTTVRDMMSWSEAVYHFLDCRGAVRMDFLVSAAEEAYALEINTIPGLQRNSNLPVACSRQGISFDALILHLLAEAVHSYRPVPWATRRAAHVPSYP